MYSNRVGNAHSRTTAWQWWTLVQNYWFGLWGSGSPQTNQPTMVRILDLMTLIMTPSLWGRHMSVRLWYRIWILDVFLVVRQFRCLSTRGMMDTALRLIIIHRVHTRRRGRHLGICYRILTGGCLNWAIQTQSGSLSAVWYCGSCSKMRGHAVVLVYR